MTTPPLPRATTAWPTLSTLQKKYAKAQLLHEKALEINRRTLNDDHILTANSYSDLAVNLNAQGKYALAQRKFRKALEIRRLQLQRR